ncbi:MAG: (Fe-S)-binding protein [Oceanipulchritudo sp.]
MPFGLLRMIQPKVSGKNVQLMITCLCDAFYADVAKAVYRVLEHAGCTIDIPEAQTCCGQPAFNAGDWDSARRVLRHTEKVFAGDGPVVLGSGSCASMLRHGTELAFEKETDREAFIQLAERTWELTEFLVHGLEIREWGGKFKGRVALHRSCHTRGTRVYESAVQLLSTIEGLELVEVGELEQCCGFGGTFCVSFPNISREMGKLKVEHLMAPEPDVVASLDMACMMHFGGMMDRQGITVRRMHVAQILAEALNLQST